MTQEMTNKAPTSARKPRDIVRDVQHMADVFDERVADKAKAIDRLAYIFGDDPELAKSVYEYVMLGHLSYHNQLRERLKQCQRDKGQ